MVIPTNHGCKGYYLKHEQQQQQQHVFLLQLTLANTHEMHKNLSTSNKSNIKKHNEYMEEYVYSLHHLTIFFCEAWVFACKAVSLHLKNISEAGSFPQIRMNIKKKHLKPPASNVTILNTTNLMACDVVPLEQIPFC